MNFIFQDWQRNKGNFKGRFLMVIFRLGHIMYEQKSIRLLFFPALGFIKILMDWFLNVDIPFKTKIGKGCVIYHGHSLVIYSGAILGNNCVLRHGVTIGNKGVGLETKSPKIGDNCDIGASSIILGDIQVGDNCTIGAGTVLVKSVPSGCTMVGNPGE